LTFINFFNFFIFQWPDFYSTKPIKFWDKANF